MAWKAYRRRCFVAELCGLLGTELSILSWFRDSLSILRMKIKGLTGFDELFGGECGGDVVKYLQSLQ